MQLLEVAAAAAISSNALDPSVRVQVVGGGGGRREAAGGRREELVQAVEGVNLNRCFVDNTYRVSV
jgi:hypothetical protein